MRGEVSELRVLVIQLLGRIAEGGREFARTYAAVLVDPGRRIRMVASGTSWRFAVALIVGYSLIAPLLCYVAWPTAAEAFGIRDEVAGNRVNMLAVFVATVVFFASLAAMTLAGGRLLTGQRTSLCGVLNCVAAALVPFSALTAAAWIVLYLYAPLSMLLVIFAALAATGFFAEALRCQFDLALTSRLYAVPLMVILALLITVFCLLVLFGRRGEFRESQRRIISVMHWTRPAPATRAAGSHVAPGTQGASRIIHPS